MSVIQSIRERYAKWAVVAIALALLGFILTDYFQAKSRMGGGQTTIGVVNGKKIEYRDFQTRLDASEAQAKARAEQMGQDYSESERHGANEALWERDVQKIIMSSELDKAGIEVGGKELTDYLYTNPPADLRQNFTDEQGNFNVAGLQNMINQMKRSTKQEERDQLNLYLQDLEYQRKMEKYNSLLTNSVYYPKWYIEKQNSESALMAKVSYVSRPYSSISDSAVTVTDKEIEDYVSKHKEQYKQDESRNIEYVLFDAAATAEDSAAIKQGLEKLKPKFALDTLPATFLSGNGSATPYADQYLNKAQIQSAEVDSIIKAPKGSVYGPFLQDHYFVLAKMIDSKIMPDSVKARHILIQTNNPQEQKVLLDDSTAKKRIDSIYTAIKGGASFDSLAKKYSADGGSAVKGGLLSNPQNPATNYFTQGQMVPEFNDFCFQGKIKETKIVKTVFGYHLIEILDQKNPQPYYKIAFFSKNISASKETERKASEEASKFSNEAKDQKSFDAAIAKSNGRYKKLTAKNIKPNDISIQEIDRTYMPIIGFGKVISCRTLIKEIYKADKGDVLKQEKIGDPKIGNKQIVAIVTDVLKEGTQPAYIARVGTPQSPGVESILKNQKKAEKIKQELGKVTTLEAAASSFKDSITTIDSVRFSGAKSLTDPKALGAVFNSANKGKVTEPIDGKDAVYVLRVDDLTTTSVLNMDLESQRSGLTRQGRQVQAQNDPFMVIKKKATIRDNRRNFY